MTARLTEDELLEGIHLALQQRDWDAVVALLHGLAVVAPEKAQAIYTAITDRTVTIKVSF